MKPTRSLPTRHTGAWPFRAVGALALVLVSLLATACGESDRSSTRLLLITIDTLRADHLGCYGYEAADTPILDELATNGTLFENAWSSYPLTLPSHASMLSGELPFEHGLRNNDLILREDQRPMLQELLAQQGFDTGAVVSAFVLDGSFGLSRGFRRYVDDFEEEGPQERPGEETTKLALELLDEMESGPFFLWVHYFDPHHPYGVGAATPLEGYDQEISLVDTQIGVLLDELKDRGLYESTAIVVVGDHGEAFGEHGEKEHGYFIYDTTVRVPLLLRLPQDRGAGRRVSEPVSITDVFPTLLHLGGVEIPQRDHARSLLNPARSGQRAFYAETLSPFFNHGASSLASVRLGSWKYIEAPEPELYDTSADAGELVNLLDKEPERANDLRQRLADMNDLGWMTSPNPLENIATDEATRERLAALGYVSAGSDEMGSWRPDPKLVLQVKADIDRGDRAMSRGDLDEAEAAYRGVLNRLPLDWKATWKLGNLLRSRGDLEGAAGVYARLVELEPVNLGGRVRLAAIRIDQKRFAEALNQLDQCVNGAPSYVPGHLYRAVALANLGRVEESREELNTVLRLDPSHAEAQRLLEELDEMQR